MYGFDNSYGIFISKAYGGPIHVNTIGGEQFFYEAVPLCMLSKYKNIYGGKVASNEYRDFTEFLTDYEWELVKKTLKDEQFVEEKKKIIYVKEETVNRIKEYISKLSEKEVHKKVEDVNLNKIYNMYYVLDVKN